MRDPNRIPAVIAALQAAWYQNPDLRLCQLIVNAASMAHPAGMPGNDPFYVEDDRMLRALKQYPSSTPAPGPCSFCGGVEHHDPQCTTRQIN